MTVPAPSTRGKRRVLRTIAKSMALGVLFVVVGVAALVVGLNSSPAQRMIRETINRSLVGVFRGRLEVDRIGRVGWSEIVGIQLTAWDPEGRPVLKVTDLSILFDLVANLRGILTERSAYVARLRALHVTGANLTLVEEGSGQFNLQRTFQLRTPTAASGSHRQVALDLDAISIDELSASVTLLDQPQVEARLARVDGSFRLDTSGITVQAGSFDLQTHGMIDGADLDGRGNLTVRVPLADGSSLRVGGGFEGAIAGIAVSTDFSWSESRLNWSLDIPRLEPKAARSLWPAYPFESELALQAQLGGTLAELALSARLELARQSLLVEGTLRWEQQQVLQLQLKADSVNLKALASAAPESKVSLQGDVSLVRGADGTIEAEAAIEVPRSVFAGVILAPVSIRSQFSKASKASPKVAVTATMREQGAPVRLRCELLTREKSSAVECDGKLDAPNLQRVRHLGSVVGGAASGTGHASFDLTRDRFVANIAFSGAELRSEAFGVGSVSGHAAMRGRISSPSIELDVQGQEVEVSGIRFRSARVKASGPLSSLKASASLHGLRGETAFFARGQLAFNRGMMVLEPLVHYTTGGLHVTARGKRLKFSASGVDAEDIQIDGLGDPILASLTLAPRTLRLQARSDGVDLSRLGRLAALSGLEGRASLDAELSSTAQHAEGRLSFAVEGATVGAVRGCAARGQFSLDGRQVEGQLEVTAGKSSNLTLTTRSLQIGGIPTEPASWQNWHGGVGVTVNSDLAELKRQLPKGWFMVDQLRGAVAIDAKLERADAAAQLPSAEFSLRATDLGFTLPWAPPEEVRGTASTSSSLTLDNLECNVGLRVDPGSGDIDASVRVADQHGALVTLDASAAAEPLVSALTSSANVLGRLQAVPVTARLTVPRRDLSTLPGKLLSRRYRGGFDAALEWSGSLAKPSASFVAHLVGARLAIARIYLPVDVELAANYDGTVASGEINAALEGRRVLGASVSAPLALNEWLSAGARGAPPWEASVHAKLAEFPLDSMRPFSDSNVRGNVSGEFTLVGLHRDAECRLDLVTSGLKVRDLPSAKGDLQLTISGQRLSARARFEEGDSTVDARVAASTTWGTALLPKLNDAEALTATLDAKRFRLALLLPLVDSTFSDFDGRLDAKSSLVIDRHAARASLTGQASLSEGLFELAAGGGEFRNVTGKVTLAPEGVLQVEDFSAQGLTGHVEGSAKARFDGHGLVNAEAHLRVPSAQPIPLSVEGVGYGSVDGNVDLSARRSADQRELDLGVDVPSLHVTIPTGSTRTVQALGAMSGVRVGTRNSRGEFVPVAEPWRSSRGTVTSSESRPGLIVKVTLGQDVAVRRGDMVNVTLAGQPQISVGDSVLVTGQIRLVRGVLDVEGKRFEIEQGTVTFVGPDPSNPQVLVTASWNAPDGTKVYAEFSGPLRTGKVTLHSDPALPNNEILSLILFGSADGAMGTMTDATSSGTGAIGVAEGAATQPLNHVLQDYGLGGVSTRVDTSNVNPRPEVDIQIARDIALQIAWVLGTPPPGSNPDRALFTLDWRLFRKWSLETTVGDAGTSIADLIWQYRY
jgi:translocation and assembly module TamB